MTAEEMRALMLHFQFIGTTWTEWEERQRPVAAGGAFDAERMAVPVDRVLVAGGGDGRRRHGSDIANAVHERRENTRVNRVPIGPACSGAILRESARSVDNRPLGFLCRSMT